jgi:ring-1,2-phenylacetyl-CoA epoxidase subunit PaaD
MVSRGGARAGAEEALFEVLRGIPDPEVPALDIVELGIVRRVELGPDGAVAVEVTPTYSGCPAMRMIEQEIVAALRANGYDRVELRTVYSPAWTTDWLSDAAKAKLLPTTPSSSRRWFPCCRRCVAPPAPTAAPRTPNARASSGRRRARRSITATGAGSRLRSSRRSRGEAGALTRRRERRERRGELRIG